MIYYSYIILLAFLQNVSFTLVSRSRNRNHLLYHIICAILSNAVWFFTFRELVVSDMSFDLAMPYVVGTVSGSAFGAKIAFAIEKRIGALADG